VRRLGLIAAVAGLTVLATAAPAFAHTTVKSSVPAANASVKSLPTVVKLTFSEHLSILPKVSVEDSAGNVINSGKATLDGAVVTQPVTPTVAGKYTVKWSAVAQDGDRSTGSFVFTLAVTPPPAPSPTAPPTATVGPPTFTPAAPAPIAADPKSTSRWWVWLLAAIGVVALVAAFLLVRRKRV
jgi:copper resistance protein C